jgi:hypothetical protein
MDLPSLDGTRVSAAWRRLRWFLCAPVVVALWACSDHRLAVPSPAPSVIDIRSFRQNVNHKLDIVFMIDDSSSMGPLQVKLAAQLPTFMDKLVDQTTGQLPDLHVGVISSSQGTGAWGGLNSCGSGNPGDDGGKFQQGPGGPGSGACPKLHAGEKYLKTGDGTAADPPNFEGDIRPLFQCMALLGQDGCGFESQFKSTVTALQKAALAADKDPDNGGFLRHDALLAIVMVTNEDDCSVANDSLLLTPAVNSAADASGLGALWSYRCNEFGHLCDGTPPPHGYDFASSTFNLPNGTMSGPGMPGAGGVVLHNCVSAEDTGPKTDPLVTVPAGEHKGEQDPTMGHLWPTVDLFTRFVKSLKDDENDILVAAITGPVESMGATYRVVPYQNANGETDPNVDHSCVFPAPNGGPPEYGDPAVRIAQWVSAFGTNGAIYPICADTFATAMNGIAEKLHQKLGASCLSPNIATKQDGRHLCDVSENITDADTNKTTSRTLDECSSALDNTPCYRLIADASDCKAADASTLFQICTNSTCTPTTTSNESRDASVSCALK